MHVDLVRPVDLGQEERALWAGFQSQQPGLDSPFLHPAFIQAASQARPRTYVAVISDDSGIAAFFPFERGRVGRGKAAAQGLSDVQGMVAVPGFCPDVPQLLRDCGLTAFSFDHLLAMQLPLLEGVPVSCRSEASPVLDLRGGFDAYQGAVRASSKSLFQSTARKCRKLEREQGPVRLAFAQQDHAVLEQLLHWKSKQYRRTGRRDRFADPSTRALVHTLLDVDDGSFTAPLTVLYAGDSIVAAHLGLASAKSLAWWFPAYDPRYAAYSPGLIMCLELARAMGTEGLELLDLGKGDEPYKERLSNAKIELVSGSLSRGRAIHTVDRAYRWPQDQLLQAVLSRPSLRGLAKSALRQCGSWRTHFDRA